MVPVIMMDTDDMSAMTKIMTRMLELIQTLATIAQQDPEWSLQVVIVTCGSEGPMSDDGNEPSIIMGAGSVWGMMRTARMEIPSRVAITCMDTDPAVMRAGDGDMLRSQLRDEVTNAGNDSTEVAYRHGVRCCRKLQPSV